MRYEVSERIATAWSDERVFDCLLEQFGKISDKIVEGHGSFVAKDIEATFGSINRTDRTEVTCRRTEDGVLVVADVTYRPSIGFWIILIVMLFTYIGWLIPVAFYLYQKGTVQKAIENALTRVRNEAMSGAAGASVLQHQASALDELEKLANLRDRGVLSDDEFETRKALLLA